MQNFEGTTGRAFSSAAKDDEKKTKEVNKGGEKTGDESTSNPLAGMMFPWERAVLSSPRVFFFFFFFFRVRSSPRTRHAKFSFMKEIFSNVFFYLFAKKAPRRGGTNCIGSSLRFASC